MNNRVSNVVKKYLERAKNERDLTVLIFGSALDPNWTSESDVDLFLISDGLNTSVEKLLIDDIVLEIQKDNFEQLLKDIESERGNLKNRNLSTMIATSNVLKVGKNDIDILKERAQDVLASDVEYSSEDEVAWRDSIDDYLSKSEKDLKRNDSISFLMDSKYALQNILELFLAKNNSYLPQPKQLDKVLSRIDLEFRNTLNEYAEASENKQRLALLKKLSDYVK